MIYDRSRLDKKFSFLLDSDVKTLEFNDLLIRIILIEQLYFEQLISYFKINQK
jgi:hypothetical protein